MNTFIKRLIALIAILGISSAFATPSTIAYMSYNNGIARIDTRTHQFIDNVQGDSYQGEFTYLALTPDKKTLYALHTLDNKLVYIDTATNQKVGDVTGLPSMYARPSSISISPDGKKGYVTYSAPYFSMSENQVYIFDTTTHAVIGTVSGMDSDVQHRIVTFTSDNKQAMVFSSPDYDYPSITPSKISFIDPKTDSVMNVTKIYGFNFGFPRSIATTLDNKKTYIGQGCGKYVYPVYTLNLDTHTYTPITGVQGQAITISPDGKKAYISCDNLTVLDTATDTILKTIPMPPNGNIVAISPDNTFAYITTQDRNVYVYDLSTLQQIGKINYNLENVYSVVFMTENN